MAELHRWKGLYKHVPKRQRQGKILEREIRYSEKFVTTEELLEQNAALCENIVQHALKFYEVEETELQNFIRAAEKSKIPVERVSIAQALKHVVRDWTNIGAGERESGFTCVFDISKSLLSGTNLSEEDIKVIIPGAGLGRLGHELTSLGYKVTINEWSMYMNAAYRFLEHIRDPYSHFFYPFLDSWSHHATNGDMQRRVPFPDCRVDAASIALIEGDFTMGMKDHEGQYDMVITYFFIDTARNLMNYLETIDRLLTPGGHRVNFGPLLYGSAPFVQLTLEEIILATEALGYIFLNIPSSCGQKTLMGRPVRGKEAVYGFNDKALVRNIYIAQAWAARKNLQ